MSKTPFEIGNDAKSLGFKADVDKMVQRFMDTIFESYDNIDNLDNLDENISGKNILDSAGITEKSIDSIDQLNSKTENWLKSIGIDPNILNKDNKISDQDQEDQDFTSNQTNSRNLSDNIINEAEKAAQELKDNIKNQIPEPGKVESKSTGGIKELLKMFAKMIYKVLGQFAEKFIYLLSPLIVLVRQLFYNLEGPNLVNPFPVIPDLISFNIQIALTAMTPLQVIHIKNQIAAFVEQAKEIVNLISDVFIPLITFITNPPKLIEEFFNKVIYDGIDMPFPEVDLGFLNIKIPSNDPKNLFGEGSLSVSKNIFQFSEDLKGKGEDLLKSFKNKNSDETANILKDSFDLDVKSSKSDKKEFDISNSDFMKEINFLLELQDNPI
ncbi:MAG: hypothetical protein ACOCP8_10280, partial [archaeon]